MHKFHMKIFVSGSDPYVLNGCIMISKFSTDRVEICCKLFPKSFQTPKSTVSPGPAQQGRVYQTGQSRKEEY